MTTVGPVKAKLVRLDHYRRVWRLGGACCARCGHLWEVVIHVDVNPRLIGCPKCCRGGSVTISGLTDPGPMPERLRDLRGRSWTPIAQLSLAPTPPSAS